MKPRESTERGVSEHSSSPPPAGEGSAGSGDYAQLSPPMRNDGPLSATLDIYAQALAEIRDHWATDYNHPKANTEMYRGPYGIGIVDGHRACAAIASRALTNKPAAEDAGHPEGVLRPTPPSHSSPEELVRALEDCVNAMHADNPADGWLEIIQRARTALSNYRSRK